MSEWNFFNQFLVLTIKNSPQIPIIKKHLESINIHNYQICKFTPNCVKTKPPSISDIFLHNKCDQNTRNISRNHFTLIRLAYKRGYQNVVIFEDDATFLTPINKKQLKHTVEWLRWNKWDLFYFGYCPYPYLYSSFKTRYIVKPYSPMLTHSYAISRRGMKKILQMEKEYYTNPIEFDKYLAYSNLSKYASFPSINFQNIDPKKYRQALELLKLPSLPFYYVSRSLEYISLFLPIIIIITIIIIGSMHAYKKLYLNRNR